MTDAFVAALAVLSAHASVQMVVHAIACLASIACDDLSCIDVASGLSLCFSTIVYAAFHERHALVAVLLFLWSFRLSIHILVRRILLGRVRARCVPENRVSTYAFAMSRCVWSLAILLTMHGIPTNTKETRVELSFVAIAALAFETLSDYELLKFRKHDKDHSLYTKGCWSLCRHPNMFGELVFQGCICLMLLEPSLSVVPNSAAFVVTYLSISVLPGGMHTLEERARNAWGSTDAYKLYAQNTPLIVPSLKSRRLNASSSAV